MINLKKKGEITKQVEALGNRLLHLHTKNKKWSSKYSLRKRNKPRRITKSTF
jgi:hypothetical protein